MTAILSRPQCVNILKAIVMMIISHDIPVQGRKPGDTEWTAFIPGVGVTIVPIINFSITGTFDLAKE